MSEKTPTPNTRIPQEIWDRIDKVAPKLGLKKSQYVRLACVERLEKDEAK